MYVRSKKASPNMELSGFVFSRSGYTLGSLSRGLILRDATTVDCVKAKTVHVAVAD